MAARTPGFRHNETTRAKIKAQQIINRLVKHIESDKPLMDASQVSAAKALLNKVLPDLKAVEVSTDPERPMQSEVTIRIIDAARD